MKSRPGNRSTAGFIRKLRRLVRDKPAGASAIEFAILAPLLILTAVATFDFGMGFYRRMQVESAARAGAQYAIVHGFSESAIASAVVNATNFTGISASPVPSRFCGCPSTTGVTRLPYCSPSSCSTCATLCSGGARAGTYVSVSAQGNYTTLIEYPGIPSSFNFTFDSIVRIQ